MSDYIERALEDYAEAWRQNQGQTKEAIDELLKSLKIQESPLQPQVGGDHYRKLAIQPAEYTTRNGLGHLAGDTIAYVTRYKDKHGKQDLEKAIHCLQLLIAIEYPETTEKP